MEPLEVAFAEIIDDLIQGTFDERALVADLVERCGELDAPADGLEEAVRARLALVMDEQREAQRSWPALTDCDRLDSAFDEMERAGLIALQYAGGTMSMGLDDVHDEQSFRTHAGRPARGYCFYHSQDISRAFLDGVLRLAFGAFAEEAQRASEIGEEIVEILGSVGLKAHWEGDAGERIAVELRWQRRVDRPLSMWAPRGRPYPFIAE